jgi:hypothetical protein
VGPRLQRRLGGVAGYTARVLPAEHALGPWCDICEEAKRPLVWLVPHGASSTLTPGEPPGLLLCGGCGGGLVEGQRVDDLELATRRQRRRGSQEP